MVSWFSDLADGISAVGSLASAVSGVVASGKAGKEQKESIRDSQGILREAKEAGHGFLSQGYGDAAGFVAPMVGPGDVARTYLRTVMASNPYQLTPEQSRAVDDTSRGAMRRVAASGLRGSGRASTAIVNDAVNRQRERFFSANQARSDRAASTLESRGASARTNLGQLASAEGSGHANIELGVATPTANLERQIGQVNATTIQNQDAELSAGVGAASRTIDMLDSLFNRDNRDAYS